MKKVSVLLALSILVLVACAKKTSGTASSISHEKAAGMFQSSCSGCHGSDGDSGRAPDLTPMKIEKDEVVKTITKGEGRMPAFADQYSKEEIDAIADYVISIRK
jgi:mono/diheme cytochrome c family protein